MLQYDSGSEFYELSYWILFLVEKYSNILQDRKKFYEIGSNLKGSGVTKLFFDEKKKFLLSKVIKGFQSGAGTLKLFAAVITHFHPSLMFGLPYSCRLQPC